MHDFFLYIFFYSELHDGGYPSTLQFVPLAHTTPATLRSQTVHRHPMTRDRRAQRSHWRHGLDLDPEQGGTVGVQPVRVAELCGIVCLHRQCRIGTGFARGVGTVRLHREVPTDDGLGGGLAHPVGPEVVDVVCLLELRYRGVGAGGDEIDKDVVHGGDHRNGFWAPVYECNDVIAIL